MGRGRSASFSDDDSDSDCYGIRSGGVSKQQRRRTKERKPKDQSVPWTEEGEAPSQQSGSVAGEHGNALRSLSGASSGTAWASGPMVIDDDGPHAASLS
jgi:hypothetical protein